MSDIENIKKLRQSTGAGFKDCSAALEEAAGYKISDKKNLTVSLSSDGKQYALRYEKFIPMLVKAIQELSAEVEKLKSGG